MLQFGISCFVHVADEKSQKLDRKGEKGMFLVYDMTSTGFSVLILSRLKVVVSDEVKFEENDLKGLTSPEPSTLSALPDFPLSGRSHFESTRFETEH
jgi:hypothetical protein